MLLFYYFLQAREITSKICTFLSVLFGYNLLAFAINNSNMMYIKVFLLVMSHIRINWFYIMIVRVNVSTTLHYKFDEEFIDISTESVCLGFQQLIQANQYQCLPWGSIKIDSIDLALFICPFICKEVLNITVHPHKKSSLWFSFTRQWTLWSGLLIKSMRNLLSRRLLTSPYMQNWKVLLLLILRMILSWALRMQNKSWRTSIKSTFDRIRGW